MYCDNCRQTKPTTTAIVNGKYGNYCSNCLTGTIRSASARNAQYQRDRDLDQHEASLIQPWDSRGYPNKEFIRLYPDEAKGNFTQEELEKYG